jgi:hypothetical protein
MGVITRTREIEEVDLWNYAPEPYECGDCGEVIEKHINQEGARYHVLNYSSVDTSCSERDCEENHKCESR